MSNRGRAAVSRAARGRNACARAPGRAQRAGCGGHRRQGAGDPGAAVGRPVGVEAVVRCTARGLLSGGTPLRGNGTPAARRRLDGAPTFNAEGPAARRRRSPNAVHTSPGERSMRAAGISFGDGAQVETGPEVLAARGPPPRRAPGRFIDCQGAGEVPSPSLWESRSATKGAWSLGRSPARSSRSTQTRLTLSASEPLASSRSMRMPRPRRKKPWR